MNFALWIAQLLLAALYGFVGQLKVLHYERAFVQMPWVAAVPHRLVTLIGVSEMLGAVGLVLPWLTWIMPRLTPLAAGGLATIMALSLPFHMMRGEYTALPVNALLLGLNVLVAVARWRGLPPRPRRG